MGVGTWIDPDHETQTGEELTTPYDNAHAVAKRFADAFAPHEASPADLTLIVDAGFLWDQSALTLTEVAEQTTPAFTVPAVNPRTDRVVIRRSDGVAQIVGGTEAVTPVPPAVPSGTLPCCLVKFLTSTPAITNAIIEDERVGAGVVDQFSIDSLTEATELDSADRLVIHDDSAGGLRKIAPATVGDFINRGFKNFFTNPRLDIWQRGTSFVNANSAQYNADRIKLLKVGTVDVDISRSTDIPTLLQSKIFHRHSLECEVTLADASLSATDLLALQTTLEGYDVQPLVGVDFVLGFWVKSSLTGTYSVGFASAVGDQRTYVTEYTIDAADTWEKKAIVLPGGLITAGSWNYETGRGLEIHWGLMSGTNNQAASLDAWLTTFGAISPNQANFAGTLGNSFKLALIQLERGTVPTGFEVRHHHTDLALCQRYFQKSYDDLVAVGTVTSNGAIGMISRSVTDFLTVSTAVSMREGPDLFPYSTATGALSNWRDITAGVERSVSGIGSGPSQLLFRLNSAVVGNTVQGHWAADAEP